MSEHPGSLLKQRRLAHEITLRQAAAATHILSRHLEALEDGRLEAFSSGQQMRGFLRSYASFLGLDVPDVLSAFRAHYSETTTPVEEVMEQATAVPEEDNQEVEAIFTEIGEKLLAQREMLGLRLDEVERQTHIKARYLQHLEKGDFGRFPSPVQARGMLGNYARFLDLDINALLLRYAEALQSKLAAQQPPRPETEAVMEIRPRQVPLWLRNLFSPDLIFVSVLAVALVVFVVWGIRRIGATQAADLPAPTAPSLVDVLIFPSTATPTPSPPPELVEIDIAAELTLEAEDAQGTPAVPAAASAPVNLTIVVRQRTYMRVVVDGQVAFDGRVIPGETFNYSAREFIELLTGNGAALHVFYNQRDMGLLGVYGEVVHLVYNVQGFLVPTPTLVSTPAPTPAGTPKPTATAINEGIQQ